ncbi:MAG: hypothetical protein E7374_01610 [Clostridiales bacterium]|nr:hypothetical protein [Clostridiales bacterium]
MKKYNTIDSKWIFFAVVVPLLVFLFAVGGVYSYYTSTGAGVKEQTATGTLKIGYTTSSCLNINGKQVGMYDEEEQKIVESIIVPGETVSFTGGLENVGNVSLYALVHVQIVVFNVVLEENQPAQNILLEDIYLDANGEEINVETGVLGNSTYLEPNETTGFEISYTPDINAFDNRFQGKPILMRLSAKGIQYRHVENASLATGLMIDRENTNLLVVQSEVDPYVVRISNDKTVKEALLEAELDEGMLYSDSALTTSLTEEFLNSNLTKNTYIYGLTQYVFVEYIQGTGLEYIDTGLAIADGYQMEMKAQMPDKPSNETWLTGNFVANPRTSYIIGYYNGNFRVLAGAEDGTHVVEIPYDSESHVFSIKNSEITIDGVSSSVAPSFTDVEVLSNNFCLFKSHHLNTVANKNIYYVKIWDLNNNLVRDFVPCYRYEDGEVGLYDKVTKTFYGNSGTGEFKYAAKNNELNKRYVEVDYIESTGTQYIDTGVNFDKNTYLTLDFEFTKISSQFLVGSWKEGNYNSSRGALFGINGSNFQFAETTAWNGSTQVADLNRHTIILNKNKQFILDTIVLDTSNEAIITTQNIRLFDASDATYAANAKIYGCQIINVSTENSIMDLVPCYDSITGEAGLYDTIENKFYGNSGTGEFGYFKKSSGEYSQVSCISGTGTQYIDTGYCPNSNTKIEVKYLGNNYSSYHAVFGTRQSVTSQAFNVDQNGSSWYCNYATAYTAPGGASSTVRQTLAMDNTGFYVDGTRLKDNSSYTLGQTVLPLYIMALNEGEAGTPYAKYINSGGKFYSVKIWEGENLLFDLIPVVRNSDDEIGFLNTVDNKFYTNAGTGTFKIN